MSNLIERNFESEFEFKSSRSGGKGGQNVNKVETKIELNFDIPRSEILNEEEKQKLFMKLQSRISKNGVLKIVSQSERSQILNKSKAIKKFYELLEKSFKEEKIRKKSNPSKAVKEKRLVEKKNLSQKKILRKVRDYDD